MQGHLIPPPQPEAQRDERSAEVTAHLRVLATSDLHMHLAPFDYYADSDCPMRGLAMTASLIRTARAEAPNHLLFDNGDFLQGSPLGDFVSLSGMQPNPMIAAMNRLGYDAVNLGNHEFSNGVDQLLDAMREAEFPFVSANVFHADTGGPLVPPSLILRRWITTRDGGRHLLRIGVTGVLPPQTGIWDRQAIGGRVTMTEMAGALQHSVPALRAAGADLVIVLAHCGIGTMDGDAGDENAGLQISAIPGVDALVLGHVHAPFPHPLGSEAQGRLAGNGSQAVDEVNGRLNGVPAVMPGFYGSHLGVVDLVLRRVGSRWHVFSGDCAVRPVATRDTHGEPVPLVEADPAILTLARPSHDQTRRWARRPIGRIARPIHTYFSMITDSPVMQLLRQAKSSFVTEQMRGTEYEGLPVLAASSPFRAGGRGGPDNYSFVPAGDLLLRHAADLYIHPNTVAALHLTGAEIREWLRHGIRVFRPLGPDDGGPPRLLHDADVPFYQFEGIGDLTYRIALGRNSVRIADLCWQGLPVTDDQRFILATNSYRASGSGGFFHPDPARVVLASQRSVRDVLIEYLSRPGVAIRPAPPAWRLCAAPGRSVLFDTAPAAIDHLDEVQDLHLQPMGLTEQGFLRLRLTF